MTRLRPRVDDRVKRASQGLQLTPLQKQLLRVAMRLTVHLERASDKLFDAEGEEEEKLHARIMELTNKIARLYEQIGAVEGESLIDRLTREAKEKGHD